MQERGMMYVIVVMVVADGALYVTRKGVYIL
jgi:hypothetical protein